MKDCRKSTISRTLTCLYLYWSIYNGSERRSAMLTLVAFLLDGPGYNRQDTISDLHTYRPSQTRVDTKNMRSNSRTFWGGRILHFFKNVIETKKSFRVFNRFNDIYFSIIFHLFFIFLLTNNDFRLPVWTLSETYSGDSHSSLKLGCL